MNHAMSLGVGYSMAIFLQHSSGGRCRLLGYAQIVFRTVPMVTRWSSKVSRAVVIKEDVARLVAGLA